ncbi:hypothetical protein FACS189419_08880 [Planctomycetales bacterium]|nr:hypothetical protein FACS189419_08880 [Planctomycetales bacterium]
MFTNIPDILYGYCYYPAVTLVILAALYGFRWKEGCWGNIIAIPCVWFSALIAINWWEDLASFITSKVPAWVFYWDSISVWVIFLVALIILDALTKKMSGVKVYFSEKIENFGNGAALFLLALSLWTFYLFAETLSPVGDLLKPEQMSEKKSDPKAAAVKKAPDIKPKNPDDTLLIQTLRLLSAGSLESFTRPAQFDTYQDFQRDHLMRRQAVMFHALRKINGQDMPPDEAPERKKEEK